MTSTQVIKICGRDLGRIYDHLTLYRVKYIQENMGDDMQETGLFVKKITMGKLDGLER